MDKIAQINNSIKMWRRRFLTPLGKQLVIKSPLLAKITHLLMSCQTHRDFKYYQWHFYDFLWTGRAEIN